MDLEGFIKHQEAAELKRRKPIDLGDSEEAEKPPPQEPEAENPESDPESEQEEEKEVPLNNEDWDKLSDDELLDTVEKHKPKARYPNRLAELVKQRKAAEKAAAEAKALAQQAQKPEDQLRYESEEPNPFESIKSPDELKKQAAEVDRLIEFTQNVLDEADGSGYDEVVYTEGEREYTKRDIKKLLRSAEKAKRLHLPNQARSIQTAMQREALEQQLMQQVQSQLEWMSGEDNDIRAQYNTMAQHPVFKQIAEKVPDAKPFLNPLIAHAANSMFSKRENISIDKPKIKPEPPKAAPGTSSHDAPSTRSDRHIKELEKKGKTQGLSLDDFVELSVAKTTATKR